MSLILQLLIAFPCPHSRWLLSAIGPPRAPLLTCSAETPRDKQPLSHYFSRSPQLWNSITRPSAFSQHVYRTSAYFIPRYVCLQVSSIVFAVCNLVFVCCTKRYGLETHEQTGVIFNTLVLKWQCSQQR
jgi:hypothetical protein